MRTALVLAGLTLLAGCASAPERPAESTAETAFIEEMCAETQCGHGVHVKLKQADGTVFEKTFDALPVIQHSGVSVYAGNTVLFEADLVDGKLANLRLVTEVVHPERTIYSKLEQDDDGSMMLVTTNPFDRHLRIRMGMMPLGHDHLVRTSSCPVPPGGSSYEIWSDPIFQIFLGDMRLMSDDEDMTCKQ